jgi:AcrR family transcriptional regulator
MKVSCNCDSKLCAKWHPKIEAAMRKAMNKARKEDRHFKTDMSSLARDIGVSRPTLYRHAPFVEDMLRRLDIERRRVDGDAARVALREKIERTEMQRDAALEEVAALRRSLAQVYQTLALNARPLAALVETELRGHGVETGTCPLCGGDGAALSETDSNVVPLERRDRS